MLYEVDGICMVPMQAKTRVEAETPEQAIELAQQRFKADRFAVLVPGSQDEKSAWDWRPEAVPIN